MIKSWHSNQNKILWNMVLAEEVLVTSQWASFSHKNLITMTTYSNATIPSLQSLLDDRDLNPYPGTCFPFLDHCEADLDECRENRYRKTHTDKPENK